MTFTLRAVLRSTVLHVTQNSKRERLAQQNAAQCRAVLRRTAPYCAALPSLYQSRDQTREYLFFLTMALQAEKLIGNSYNVYIFVDIP